MIFSKKITWLIYEKFNCIVNYKNNQLKIYFIILLKYSCNTG